MGTSESSGKPDEMLGGGVILQRTGISSLLHAVETRIKLLLDWPLGTSTEQIFK